MNIPTYAKCFMCKEWIEDKQDWNKGTCAVAEDNAREGMIQAGITPLPRSRGGRLERQAVLGMGSQPGRAARH